MNLSKAETVNKYHSIANHVKELKKKHDSIAIFVIVIGYQIDYLKNSFLTRLKIPTQDEKFPLVFNLSASGELIWHAQLCSLLLSINNVSVACIHQFDHEMSYRTSD